MPYGDADALAAAVTDRDRRDPAGADPGRGRRRGPARRLPRGRPRGSPTSTAPCSGSTRCRPAWAGPGAGSPTTPAGVRARPRDRRQGPRPAASRSAPASGSAPPASCSSPATTAPRSAATRSPCAAALAVIDTIEADGLLEHVTVLGQKLRDGLAADPRVTEVRGAGLLIGLDLAPSSSAEVVRRRAGGRLHRQQPHAPTGSGWRRRWSSPRATPRRSSRRGRRSWTRRGLSMTRHFLRGRRPQPRRAGRGPRPRRPAQGLAVRRAPVRRPAVGRDDLRQADAAHPGLLRRRPSPSSAATRCWSTASSPASASASPSRTSPGCSAGRSSTIVWRTFAQTGLELMAEYAGVPVVNALTDEFHPCQLLADLLTVREHKGDAGRPDRGLRRRRRQQHGQLVAAGRRHRGHARAGRGPGGLLARPRRCSAGQPRSPRRPAARRPGTSDPVAAVTGADVVVTDTWVSMGKEDEEAARAAVFAPYTLTAELLGHAEARRHRAALPAGLPRQGDRRRGHRRPAERGLGRGGEPPARPEGGPDRS